VVFDTITFYVFFQNPKKNDFLRFFSCWVRPVVQKTGERVKMEKVSWDVGRG